MLVRRECEQVVITYNLKPLHFVIIKVPNDLTGAYEEKYTFIDPTVPLLPKRSYKPNVAYIISMFEADDDVTDQLDQKWTLWSGADFIASRTPPQLQLQRLTLHKRSSHTGNFMYILMCELSEALAHLPVALEFVETIRARQCGYTTLYSIDHFF